MTHQCDPRYVSMASIISVISDLLILGSTSGSYYLSLSFFCPACWCTVSSCTSLISQSKVHLHLWWDKKAASFRFSWAMTKTCCPLSCIPSAFLQLGFLMTLQMSLNFCSWGPVFALWWATWLFFYWFPGRYTHSWAMSLYTLAPLQNIMRHHLPAKYSFLNVFPYLHILHQIFLIFFQSNLLNLRFWPHIVYVWIVLYFDFAFCSVWLSLLLRSTKDCLRLFCVSLLWPWN